MQLIVIRINIWKNEGDDTEGKEENWTTKYVYENLELGTPK